MTGVLDVLLESSWRIGLVAAGVSAILAVARVRQSAARHLAWTVVLAAMLLMPWLPAWAPDLPVAIPMSVPNATVPMSSEQAEPPTIDRAAAVPQARVGAPASLPVATTAVGATRSSRPLPVAAVWPATVVLLWAVVAMVMLARLVGGWWLAARLARSARRVSDRPAAYESDLVATPLVVGVFRPRVILPACWTGWPDATRQAVLAHETAHLRRRDPLVSFLARVNRCVFWFHPLAWWLERRLAIAAEHACDDEAVRAVGERHRYAELLVEMARACSQRGGRVAWQGIGMSGGGLGQRVERLIDGTTVARISRTRAGFVVVACAAVIGLAVACQREVAPLREVPPLREDTELAKQVAEQRAREEKWKRAREMTLEQATALETVVAKTPDDLDQTAQLLVFYRESGQKLLGWHRMIEAKRPHILRAFQRHPESQLASWPLTQATDPEGYAQAREIWLAHVARPGVTPKVLGNAANFFRVSEKPKAEELLRRALAIDPQGPQPRVVGHVYSSPWTYRLGHLYAQALVGSNDETIFNVVKSISVAEARGPYAASVRRTLETTTDAVLLQAAGGYLINNASQVSDKVGFDPRALGRTYLERAVTLDPKADHARRLLSNVRDRQLHDARWETMRASGREGVQRVAALPEADRFEVLAELADEDYMLSECLDCFKGKAEGPEAALRRSKQYAQDALALAPKFREHPRYSVVVYRAHLALGTHALHEGNRALAVRHLLDASKAPASDELAEIAGTLEGRLANYLLKYGERESVAQYYERVAQLRPRERDRMMQAAAAIRDGLMPENYQRMLASGHLGK